MAVFDVYLKEVAAYVDEMRQQGRPIREFNCPESPEDIAKGLPVKVGPKANPGIILRSDTFVELGNPLAGSCAMVLWTDDPSLVRKGRISLVGPDIPESAEASLPLGQILIVGGKEFSDKDHESLIHRQYVSDEIEGYMIKSAPDRIWSRVSREGGKKGFNFEVLGKAMMSIVKSGDSRVEATEIIFVTSSKEDVQGLISLAAQVNKISKEIVKETWKLRGYDIECSLDCNSCGDKPVCDDIRDVLEVRKKKEKEAKASNIS